MSDKRTYITKEQALSILPAGDYVHTFLNNNFGLIGADWTKKEIVEKIENSDILELTGESAMSMGHGLAAYNKDTKYHSDILFIATNMEKVAELEKLLKEGSAE